MHKLARAAYLFICNADKPATFAWIERQLENDGEDFDDIVLSNALQSLVEEGYITKDYDGEVLVYKEVDLD
ncbi:hypothetical protein D3C74_131720 [compost metagenome]